MVVNRGFLNCYAAVSTDYGETKSSVQILTPLY